MRPHPIRIERIAFMGARSVLVLALLGLACGPTPSGVGPGPVVEVEVARGDYEELEPVARRRAPPKPERPPPPARPLAIKARAKAAYKRGLVAFKSGRFRKAIPFFREANRLFPGAAPKWHIAVCYDKLGACRTAVEAYRTFVGSKPSRRYAARVAEAHKRIAVLSSSCP